MAKHPGKVNATKLSTTLQPPKKSISRNARFFGKFSFLAGLGLPDAVPLPIKREDLLYERVPTRFSASYNFPPVRWGPYFAAVYEPTPIVVHNPLGYMAAALNPFNWFAGTGSTSSTGRPETTTSLLTTNLPIAVSNQQDGDVVVLLQEPENEIPNEDRFLINDKLEMQTEKQEFYTDKVRIVIDFMYFGIHNNCTCNLFILDDESHEYWLSWYHIYVQWRVHNNSRRRGHEHGPDSRRDYPQA